MSSKSKKESKAADAAPAVEEVNVEEEVPVVPTTLYDQIQDVFSQIKAPESQREAVLEILGAVDGPGACREGVVADETFHDVSFAHRMGFNRTQSRVFFSILNDLYSFVVGEKLPSFETLAVKLSQLPEPIPTADENAVTSDDGAESKGSADVEVAEESKSDAPAKDTQEDVDLRRPIAECVQFVKAALLKHFSPDLQVDAVPDPDQAALDVEGGYLEVVYVCVCAVYSWCLFSPFLFSLSLHLRTTNSFSFYFILLLLGLFFTQLTNHNSTCVLFLQPRSARRPPKRLARRPRPSNRKERAKGRRKRRKRERMERKSLWKKPLLRWRRSRKKWYPHRLYSRLVM